MTTLSTFFQLAGTKSKRNKTMSTLKDKDFPPLKAANGKAGNPLAFHTYTVTADTTSMDTAKPGKPNASTLSPRSHTANADAATPMDTSKPGKANASAAGTRRPLNTTPTKLPPAKKIAIETGPELSLADVLAAIKSLGDKVDGFGKQLQENSDLFTSIVHRVDQNSVEIAECKSKIDILEKEHSDLKQENATLRDKVLEVERYKRRWNLRLSGLKEQEGEDVRAQIEELLLNLFPQWADNIGNVVDSVHRVGKKENGKGRQVIMQFVRRLHRDAVWKTTKDSQICQARGIRFVQDFIKEDRLAREQLWPKIKNARSQGKVAFYKGHIAIIDGRVVTA